MIPLDNLYEWIADKIPDTVIYRFFPNGSKNFLDVNPVDDRYLAINFDRKSWFVPVVCHDQEPLNFELNDLKHHDWQNLREICQRRWLHRKEYWQTTEVKDFWKELKEKNLFAAVEQSWCDRPVLLHSEKRSIQVDQFNAISKPAYWWSHGMIARDWYRYAQHEEIVSPTNDFDFDFNIYSRAWSGTREYRLHFAQTLVDFELLSKSRMTFSSKDDGIHYSQHQFKNKEFKVTSDLNFIPNQQISSHASATYDRMHYKQCAIDVVLETLFDDERLHLTEKTLRPIACGKPFLLMATHGSLQYLRDYGFKTFQEVFDESYDLILDPVCRMRTVAEEMVRLANLPTKEKKEVYCRAHEIARYNKNRFFGDDFFQMLQTELTSNLKDACQEVRNNHMNGNLYQYQLKATGKL